MANRETITGTVEALTKYGVVIDGVERRYSKFFSGSWHDESFVGQKVTLTVDHHPKGDYIVDAGSGRGGGRERSGRTESPPERGRRHTPQFDRSKEEGIRIARSVAVDRAIQLKAAGISYQEIEDQAYAIEQFIHTGTFPAGAVTRPLPDAKPETTALESAETPPAKKPRTSAKKTKKVASSLVNALWKEVRSPDFSWKAFEDLAKTDYGKSPYWLDSETFEVFATSVRTGLRNAA